MKQAIIDTNLHENLHKTFKKLVVQATERIYELNFLRESVAQEQEACAIEDAKLQDFQRRKAEAVREQQRAEADAGVALREYSRQREELTRKLHQKSAAALGMEVDRRMVAALRDLIAEREKEVENLRRASQWKPLEGDRISTKVGVNFVASQIAWDVKEITRRVKDAWKELLQLKSIHREAQNALLMLRAYKEAKRISDYHKIHVLDSLKAQRYKLREHLMFSDARKLVQMMVPMPKSTPSDQISSTSMALRKNLETEKLRGAELVKELCQVTQLASAVSARRAAWLNQQIQSQSDEQNTISDE